MTHECCAGGGYATQHVDIVYDSGAETVSSRSNGVHLRHGGECPVFAWPEFAVARASNRGEIGGDQT